MMDSDLDVKRPELITGLARILLKPFAVGKSVRSRLAATLCAVVVPAILLAIGWAWHENVAAQALRLETARQDVGLSAMVIGSSLRTARHFGQSIATFLERIPNQSDRCSALINLSDAASTTGWNVAIADGDRFPCGDGTDVNRIVLSLLRRQMSRGVEFPVTTIPALRNAGVLGIPFGGGDRDMLLLFLPSDGLGVGAQFLPEGAKEISVRDAMDQNQSLDVGNPPGLTNHPVPEAPPPIAQGNGALPKSYFTAPVTGTPLVVVAGYAPSHFSLLDGKLFWVTATALVSALILTIFGAVVAIDRTLGRWIAYLRRIAVAHSRGRLSVRASRLDEAPEELADLGRAINLMAENSSIHATMLETAIVEKEAMLQELHHRVKNNFQIVSSLLTLQRKAAPPERALDLRFVEDHVHAMAAAYRVAYTSQNIALVSPIRIAKDVITLLCDNAGLRPNAVHLHVEDETGLVDLDKAIQIGLTLAYLLPPYLDAQSAAMKVVTADVRIMEPSLVVELYDIGQIAEDPSNLRQRLADSYVNQFRVSAAVSCGESSSYIVRIPLDASTSTHLSGSTVVGNSRPI